MSKATIIIATYNESGSIGQLLDCLFTEIFPQIPNWLCQVVVVDDTSPDKTYEIVKDYQKKYSRLHLIINPIKKGMGNAVVIGYHYAIDKLSTDIILEFDADFQHPPQDIPKLLAEIDRGSDFVIGSRKIKGGSIPQSWGFIRKFFTYVGGFVSRFILFFPFKSFWQITDPTSGLRASRVKGFVDQIDLDHLYSLKFAYKIDLLFRLVNLGARVKEIPLQFGLRLAGESKISGDTAKDILMVSLFCRWFAPLTQKFLKFATVGFIGYLINAVFLALFSELLAIEWLSWFLSTEMAIISNFSLNNLWTFKSQSITRSQILPKFLQFNLTSTGALLIQTVFGTLAVRFFGPQYRQLLLPLIILLLVLPYNWLMYTKIIWRR
jgi:dolichol-phosphate mannosyltransferase